MKWWPGHIDDVWRALGLDGRVSHPREALEAIGQLKRDRDDALADESAAIANMSEQRARAEQFRRERDSDRMQVVGYYIAGTHGDRPPTTEELRAGACDFGYEYLYPEDAATDDLDAAPPEPACTHDGKWIIRPRQPSCLRCGFERDPGSDQ